MSHTLTLDKKRSFYQNAVIEVLSAMTKGRMYFTLPNGETIAFGNGEGIITARIDVISDEFFKSIIFYGDIGFGEAYVDGLWDTDNITNVIKWVLLNMDAMPLVSGSKARSIALNMLKWFNKLYHAKRENTVDGSRKNIAEHYDLNNDFFATFLDPTMTYSAGYFCTDEMSLEESQYAKYERLARQLHLKPTDHVLEIGSGWGGNAIYMAKNYGCKVTSLTISEEQLKMARERVKEEGLESRVEILMKDYRHMEGVYDKIVSVEMLEAVGHKYLGEYFRRCHEMLKPTGILALQVITSPDSRYDAIRKGVDWIQKHIFPGSLLPSVAAINAAVNRSGDMTMVDLKDMGLDYAHTLKLWYNKFNASLKEVKALGFDDRFIRKWNYYLCYCEAAFAMRNINVMQLTYSRPNNTER
ncbi:SAM-dependent methyltransferase [Mucilaginibacter ginkgonis]|uniref:Class I SAM-dependent methyltransferase n=1 Tax=Mucilaginibacter ginkgonis TaxID=2682091 RepID=A0A6I4IMG5_9SPHI|nr:cyclopropane-fatty-acyl-phospholipid synthase family protein [Mucilaginibacter ginkgonis]QQL50380.1 class I SAM-dependent methyltransferase [Mucilaginibacter ginkgonis]